MSSSILKQRLYKSYPPEFRTQAIKLALTKEKTIAQTAKDLGVPIGTLNSWVRRAEKGEWTVPDENLVDEEIVAL